MSLVEMVYQLTASFPEEEKFGLTNQIRRSAVSVSSKIAEGAGRNSKKEFRNFLGIANGSLNELMTQLELANRLRFIEGQKLERTIVLGNEIQKIRYIP